MSYFLPGDRIRVDWPFDLNDGRTGCVTATGIQRLAEPACEVCFDDEKSLEPGAVNSVPVPCRNLILDERPDQHTDNPGDQT